MFSRHFDAVRHTRWAERLPRLSFIHLTRLDVVGQAISHVRATQTQQWTARRPALAEPAYDFDAINAEFLRLINSQARWAYFLGRNGVPVLHIVYEQLILQPQATVDAVARFIGWPDPVTVDFTKVSVTVQRDELTLEWRKRFIAQARDLTQFH